MKLQTSTGRINSSLSAAQATLTTDTAALATDTHTASDLHAAAGTAIETARGAVASEVAVDHAQAEAHIDLGKAIDSLTAAVNTLTTDGGSGLNLSDVLAHATVDLLANVGSGGTVTAAVSNPDAATPLPAAEPDVSAITAQLQNMLQNSNNNIA